MKVTTQINTGTRFLNIKTATIDHTLTVEPGVSDKAMLELSARDLRSKAELLLKRAAMYDEAAQHV